MRLSYRGVDYEYSQPILEATESDILNRQSGSNEHCQTLQEMPIPRSSYALKYRGVSYVSSQPEIPVPAAVAQTAACKQSECKTVPLVFPVLQETAKIHRVNLQRSLERRLQRAKAEGDQKLVRLLEAESRELAF